MKKILLINLVLLLSCHNFNLTDECIEDFLIRQPSTPNPNAIGVIIKSSKKIKSFPNIDSITMSIYGGYFDEQFPKNRRINRFIRLDKNKYLIVDFFVFKHSDIANKNYSVFFDSLANCTYEGGLSIELKSNLYKNDTLENMQVFCPCYPASKVVSIDAYTHD